MDTGAFFLFEFQALLPCERIFTDSRILVEVLHFVGEEVLRRYFVPVHLPHHGDEVLYIDGGTLRYEQRFMHGRGEDEEVPAERCGSFLEDVLPCDEGSAERFVLR